MQEAIGMACARLFARQGMSVLIADTDEAAGSFAAAALDGAEAPVLNHRIG